MSTETITKVPVHMSMIMDGNGRWAKERGKERVYGHFEGVESVRACVEAALEHGVKYLSVFAFSEENWNRPEEEVIALMGLMVKAMAAELRGIYLTMMPMVPKMPMAVRSFSFARSIIASCRKNYETIVAN